MPQSECDHPKDKLTFVHTDADWWDGDEEDVYRCECGTTVKKYIPR